VVVSLIDLIKTDFFVDEIIDRIQTDEMGCVVTFLGVVRNNSKGKNVERIEIQVYEEMALKQLELIREEAISRFAIDDVAIVHRYGILEVSEKIMMIAVGAGHRVEAFDACRFIIDSIKEKVPIWKKESFQDGDFWVEGEKDE
jgi:molybdopterin synthase catalytic subunit